MQKLSIMSLRGVHPFLHRTTRLHISVFKKFGFSMHPLNPSLPLSHQAPFSLVHATHGFDHFLWRPKSTFSSPFEDAFFEDAAASTPEFKEEKEDAKKKTKKKRKRAVFLKAVKDFGKDWKRRLILSVFCLCVFTTLTNDTKQLNKKAREEREKNSQTNFDTLNTQKETLDDAKNVLRQKRRERRRGRLLHLYYYSRIT